MPPCVAQSSARQVKYYTWAVGVGTVDELRVGVGMRSHNKAFILDELVCDRAMSIKISYATKTVSGVSSLVPPTTPPTT